MKHLVENHFYHLSKEFNAIILDLFKKKRFFPYGYWDCFEIFEEGLPSKERFYNTLTNFVISDSYYDHVLNVWIAFKVGTEPFKKICF